ncbi:MAG: hypothetical protein JST50_12535 [Bacteroidetes bacterium]|jgi:quinol monooxygenase YgiN|nr:hypothetical protein [Bacteroidota bacterium]
MTRIRKVLQFLPALILAAALVSCGGSATKGTGDSTKMADTAKKADTTKKAMHPALAAPFDVLAITHDVKDYDKWRPGYNTDSTNRKAAGLEDLVVGRGTDNGNHIVIYEKVSDIAKAKAFAADPKLKDAMDKAGVISKPELGYFHVIRFNGDSKEKQWVVVTHKVKDFDAWVKVYDGEGKDKRASEGLVDVALARGTDDPNLVQLVFDITDMAKAKAAITSPEKKKLMESAGVIGKPSIEFYTTAE